jgi:hypothetical protein
VLETFVSTGLGDGDPESSSTGKAFSDRISEADMPVGSSDDFSGVGTVHTGELKLAATVRAAYSSHVPSCRVVRTAVGLNRTAKLPEATNPSAKAELSPILSDASIVGKLEWCDHHDHNPR